MNPEPTSSAKQLAGFLEAAKAKGASDELLAKLFRRRGWPEKKAWEALGDYYEQATGMSIPGRKGGAAENARDAFLYLVSFSTLGVWTIALGALAFTYLDIWFPDTVTRRYVPDPTWAIAGNLASILVAFPIYLVVMRVIVRDLTAHPEKHESGVRKWLSYIALFVAAGVVIGDLITFLTFFLHGELTIRFVLKVATALVIAGGVFWYYLDWLRQKAEAAESDAS